jgi:hypothetical protein
MVSATYPKIFGQRCATHGFSLLHKDIADYFKSNILRVDVVRTMVRLAEHVKACFNKREKDCVSELAKAAAMMFPIYYFPNIDVANHFVINDGQDAFYTVVQKYFGSPVNTIGAERDLSLSRK